MDLDRIKSEGKSKTGKAWITNPLRAVLWPLVGPYFNAILQSQRAELVSLRQEMSSTVIAEMRQELSSTLTSYLSGVRKEVVAITHRLAGLEEEAVEHERAQMALSKAVAAATEGKSAADVASDLQEVGLSVQALNDRIDALGAAAAANERALGEAANAAAARGHEAAAAIASLHQEVRLSVQAVNERIDALVRGAPLRAGDRVSVGQNGLVLAATALGTRFLVRQHDLIGGLVAEGQEWEPHVRTVIERAAKSDGVAVDAGAYIGLLTVTMSRCFRMVHSFEPQKGVYQLLCGNLVLNDCTNVSAHNLALYDRATAMRLAPPERQSVPMPLLDGQPDYSRIGNAAALTFEPVEDRFGEVRAVVLDDLGLENVSIIKVDTQGADLKVLRGAQATIRRDHPLVLFEWEQELAAQHGDALEDYHGFFAALDYNVEVLKEVTEGHLIDYLATPR
jgi:FkbM family methyltransferase